MILNTYIIVLIFIIFNKLLLCLNADIVISSKKYLIDKCHGFSSHNFNLLFNKILDKQRRNFYVIAKNRETRFKFKSEDISIPIRI